MTLAAETKLGLAGGLALTVVDAAGAVWLGILSPAAGGEGRWLAVLTALADGNPSASVVAYLLLPGFAAGVVVFGVLRLRGVEMDAWARLGTYLLLVLTPVVGLFVLATVYAIAVLTPAVGPAGLLFGLPIALLFVAIGTGVLLVCTAATAAVGLALVEAPAAVARRMA